MKKTNVLKAFVAVATIIVALTFTQCGASIDKQLQDAARQINATCPMDMGGGVRLDKVSTEPGKKLTYSMTLSIIDADDEEAQAFADMIKPMMVQSIKSNDSKDVKLLKDLKPTMVYMIYDRNGELITKVEVLPEDYS